MIQQQEADIAREAQAAQEYLLAERGWAPVNAAGDIASSDRQVWFTVGYAHREFTFAACRRRNGAGPAIGTIRIRVTDALASRFENIGVALAIGLADIADRITLRGQDDPDLLWPPPVWLDVQA